MDSNMYRGKITIIAIGMYSDQGLFIINGTEYIYIHKKFIYPIIEMIKTPNVDTGGIRFQFFHVLDGIKERNCFIKFTNGKYEATIDNATHLISDGLLQSFILSGFLKRFLTIEENNSSKPSFFKIYQDQGKQENVMKECAASTESVYEKEILEGDVEPAEIPYKVVNKNIADYDDDNLFIEDLQESVDTNLEPIKTKRKGLKWRLFNTKKG